MSAVSPRQPAPLSARFQLLLAVLFFISGMSALFYQIAWQRHLFTIVGVDIESTTLIVSVFMLGLGVGGGLGGWLADRFPKHGLQIFCLLECCIGFYGLCSPFLLGLVGELTIGFSRPLIALTCFLFLAIPTCAMGATLPVLTMHLNRTIENIGRATGFLYAANTFGAALGAFVPAMGLYVLLDLNQSIYVAAAGNLLSASIVALTLRTRDNECQR